MFLFSKLLSAVTQPVFWLGVWWLLALLMLNRFRKTAAAMLWLGLCVLALLGVRALPDALLRPLENRYPVPAAEQMANYAGVIVLGGSFETPEIFTGRGQVPLNSAAERLTLPAAWLRSNPGMELIFTGGEGRLLATGTTEAAMAEQFFREQGLNMANVHLESSARNTRENALNVAKLLGPRCHTHAWLLVTSAWHMPRAMAEFNATGCRITPYPVDFLTGQSTPLTEYSLAQSLMRWQIALHEWLGELVYGWTRSPAPAAKA
jgi:uncharacterized SAM-binding protein YcdF (DUF218 family)